MMKDYTHWHEYSSFVADIDLQTDAGGPPGSDVARCVRVLEIGGGVLSVRFANGETETLTVKAADLTAGVAVLERTTIAAILSATNVARVWVGW